MSTQLLFKPIEVIVDNSLPRVSQLLRYYPHLKRFTGLKQKLDIFKRGNTNAIVIFPGKSRCDSENLKKSKTFKEIFNAFDSTIIIVNWPDYAYIPEFSYAQIEDFCISEGITSIKILSTSYGGYCALELIADIKKNNLPIKISGLITIVSPFTFKDIRLITRFKIQATRMCGEFIKQSLLFYNPKKFFKKGKNTKRLSRKGSLIGSAFNKDEIFSSIPVLAITTKGFDIFVDNYKAAKKFKKLFNKTEIMQVVGSSFYKGFNKSPFKMVNIAGAHIISGKDIRLVQDKIIQFFNNT